MSTLNEKYMMTDDVITIYGHKLYRIKALVDIPKYHIKAGELGGHIESAHNLSHRGQCWVGNNAMVYGNAVVAGDSCVINSACVYENAIIFGNARISGNSTVYGKAVVKDNATVYGNAVVHGNSILCDDCEIHGNACIYGSSNSEVVIKNKVNLSNNSKIYGKGTFDYEPIVNSTK